MMVDRSAMPVIYPLPAQVRVNVIRVRGRIEGSLRVSAERQGQEKFDDYAFRIGLVEPGERTLNALQRRTAAPWVRKLFELAPKGSGISQIHFFNVGTEKTQIGRRRQHLLSDLIVEKVVAVPRADGRFDFVHRLERPLETIAVWLSSDGDDVRKFALTAHVACSVGWLGAVASFLALGLAGLTSQDAQIMRAAYLAMDLTGWFIIVPLTVGSLLPGLVQALGTPWGLFRHYWIVMKLLITLLSTLLLLVHMQPTGRLAGAAVETLSNAHFRQMRTQLVADAGLALLALLVATTLAVYKPRGMTRYGARQQHEQAADTVEAGAGSTARMPRWVKMLALIGILVLFLGRMFAGHGGPHAPGRDIGAGDDAGYTWPSQSQKASLKKQAAL
jgi:hypothetical protein